MTSFTFPLSSAQFFDLLPISEITFYCPPVSSFSRTGAGEVIVADIGARLWRGEITLGKMTRAEAGFARTMIDMLGGAGRSFMVWDRAAAFPLRDPRGAALGAATPTIHTLGSDGSTLRLAGLPAGYQMEPGDYLAFTYGTNPTRYALHALVTSGVANSSGVTPLMEVLPAIRPGAVVGATVSLRRAPCKAVLMPDSVRHGPSKAVIREGSTFAFIQTLR